MRLRYIHLTILLFLLSVTAMSAQEQRTSMLIDSISDEVLDTMNIKKKTFINDYSMIGFQYGAGLSQVIWNPSQKQEMLFMPYNIGIMYTRYGKMFGYMPYFGFQAGLFYTQEGYRFYLDDFGTGYSNLNYYF